MQPPQVDWTGLTEERKGKQRWFHHLFWPPIFHLPSWNSLEKEHFSHAGSRTVVLPLLPDLGPKILMLIVFPIIHSSYSTQKSLKQGINVPRRRWETRFWIIPLSPSGVWKSRGILWASESCYRVNCSRDFWELLTSYCSSENVSRVGNRWG